MGGPGVLGVLFFFLFKTIKKWIFRRFWGSKKFFSILGKFKGWSDPALEKKKKKKNRLFKKNFFCLKRWKNGFLGDFGGQKIFSPFWENLRGESNRALRKILQNMVKTPICKKSLRAGLRPKVDPPKKKSTFQKKKFFV